jgi:hypothetical protein
MDIDLPKEIIVGVIKFSVVSNKNYRYFSQLKDVLSRK